MSPVIKQVSDLEQTVSSLRGRLLALKGRVSDLERRLKASENYNTVFQKILDEKKYSLMGLRLDGNLIIDQTDTEALLVRKNNDGGDLFVVDTVNERAVLSGFLSLSEDAIPQYPLDIKYTPEDTSARGISLTYEPSTTVDETSYHQALLGSGTYDISSGKTNSGYYKTMQFSTLCDNLDGTLSQMIGMHVYQGLQTGSAGTITNLYGLRIKNYWQDGEVTNSYLLYLDDPTTGGSNTSNYGIYAESNMDHYFGGDVEIDGTLDLDSSPIELDGYETVSFDSNRTGFVLNGPNARGVYVFINNNDANDCFGVATDPSNGNSADTLQFVVRGNGNIFAHGLASGSGTDLIIDGNDEIEKKSSSRRYKQNIIPLDAAPDMLFALEPVTFEWKKGNVPDYGFIAEDVEKVAPELCTYNKDGSVQSVKYDSLIAPILVKIREQEERIAHLEKLCQRLQ